MSHLISLARHGSLLYISAALLLTACIALIHYRCPEFSAKFARAFEASANHMPAYILASALLPVVLRLALLPWMPVPEPHIHDEFSHLLVGDTLAHGRFANPPHPLWRHLETIYVLQKPAYASVYPLGQGIILGLGEKLTGIPWAGVLLSTMLMCGAITWMLYGCLPRQWAAIGGLVAASHFGPANYWVNSYWGGSFAALGGALLFGALCRLGKSSSKALGLIAGLGWSIVWLTRPFESVLLFVLSCVFLAALAWQDPYGWKRWLGPVMMAAIMPLTAGCVTALHDHAATGSFATLPYSYAQRVLGTPQSFVWQKVVQEPPFQYAALKEMYLYERRKRDWVDQHPALYLRNLFQVMWDFFVTRWYTLPLLLVPLGWRNRNVRAAICLLLAALSASWTEPFFFPHYMAPYSSIVFLLLTCGMMLLSSWYIRGRAVGGWVLLFLVLGAVATTFEDAPRISIQVTGIPRTPAPQTIMRQVSDRLAAVDGNHVVLVRYDPAQVVDQAKDLFYNGADVDSARIVWGRVISPAEDAEVARYYKDRQIWIADIDNGAVRLSPYKSELQAARGPGSK